VATLLRFAPRVSGSADMALAPVDMDNSCCKKQRCLAGVNAGQVYDVCSPCAGVSTFDPETCDCSNPSGVYLVTVSLTGGNPIGVDVKYNYVSVYDPYIEDGTIISSGIGVEATLSDFACMLPEDCGGQGGVNLAVYDSICADDFGNPYVPEGTSPSNNQTTRWDAWGIPDTLSTGICTKVCENNPNYTVPAVANGMTLRRYSEQGYKSLSGYASIVYPAAQSISCIGGYSMAVSYGISLIYIGPGVIQDYYSATANSGLHHTSDTPLVQDLPGPS